MDADQAPMPKPAREPMASSIRLATPPTRNAPQIDEEPAPSSRPEVSLEEKATQANRPSEPGRGITPPLDAVTSEILAFLKEREVPVQERLAHIGDPAARERELSLHDQFGTPHQGATYDELYDHIERCFPHKDLGSLAPTWDCAHTKLLNEGIVPYLRKLDKEVEDKDIFRAFGAFEAGYDQSGPFRLAMLDLMARGLVEVVDLFKPSGKITRASGAVFRARHPTDVSVQVVSCPAKEPASGSTKKRRKPKRQKRTQPTTREQQALELRSRRYTNSQIAEEMGITPGRVSQLLKSVAARSGPPSRSVHLGKTRQLLDHDGSTSETSTSHGPSDDD